jgi:ribosomal protein S27E
MFEIEMPCCGTPARFDESANSVDCETCGVVLDLAAPTVEAFPLAA